METCAMITETKNQSWMTPKTTFAGLMADYQFTRDCAASLANHLLPAYWTAAHNALAQVPEPGERLFINPPFGLIWEFLEWAYAYRETCFSLLLLPANIETEWFLQLAVLGEKHTFNKRVSYVAPPAVVRRRMALGKKATSPSFASITVMFGPDVIPENTGLRFTAVRDGYHGGIVDGYGN